jgi:hypothetical protein
MKGKAYWVGREVEGRLVGLKTVFIRYSEPQKGLIPSGIHHYYFCMEWVQRGKKNFEVIRAYLDKGFIVTVESNEQLLPKLPDDLRIRCNILFRVSQPAIRLLKESDCVAIDYEPYRVKIFTMWSAQQVRPDDYASDDVI